MKAISKIFIPVSVVILALLASPAVAVQSQRTPAADADAYVASGSARAAALTTGTTPACEDDAYNLIGGRWSRPVEWLFKAGSTPDGMNTAAVEAVIVKSFNNITGAFNDCGRADKVGAQNAYEGRTTRAPSITREGRCGGRDGRNVVGFGRLPAGILAVTCTRHFGNLIVEADIRINTRYPWAVSQAACVNRELLEPTVTHEVGHVYGLGHVSERRHPLMTMSTRSDGPCSNEASTLGLGDMLGLEALY